MNGTTPDPQRMVAPDGQVLHGLAWRHPRAEGSTLRPVVIINPATSVRSDYYSRFAAFLHGQGFDVLTYDYRGIGGSRPASLRGFQAGWLDCGQRDFEALLQHAAAHFPGQPVQVVAHSVGGVLVGLAPSNHTIARVFTMGAQYAHWRDYAPGRRSALLWKWHVAMPLLTALLGYFPGKRLGWLEDTPRGVVRDWTARHPRFEDGFDGAGSQRLDPDERDALVARFASLTAPLLALSVADDEFGTIPATQRLLRYFRGSATTHLHVEPGELGLAGIGHFAFFHSRFEHSLWQIPLQWLRSGTLAACPPGRLIPVG
ncbi:alpha/beta fold hydrolase [Acidovorax sp.]|jgi:predicted alpha/beta hydrolase|uniref:alpha/beta hydrolase family protein n=1 Tax=Acidovorax sp. TaxID=1872122 RepID=UPI00391F27DA